MGGIFAFIIIVAIFIGLIFLRVKMNNVKYRAKQSVLNKVGVGQSNMISVTDDLLEIVK